MSEFEIKIEPNVKDKTICINTTLFNMDQNFLSHLNLDAAMQLRKELDVAIKRLNGPKKGDDIPKSTRSKTQ